MARITTATGGSTTSLSVIDLGFDTPGPTDVVDAR